MDVIKPRQEYLLFLLNSYFKSLGLVFTIFRSIRARDYISYEVSKTICNNIFGLKISVYPNNNINIEYLSSCKNKSGSEILGRIKKFACKIDCREIKLDDGQYLDVKVLLTSIEESNEVFWIEDFCYIDIATTGDSWYNKMGFHRKGGNPIEDKLRNEELSKIPLIEIINNESDIVAFQKAFEIDTDINIYDSINKIFIIIKRDYLKNKRKPLTMDQFNIINHIISKYLKRHFIYDTILYYHPNCNISHQTFNRLGSKPSSKRMSTKRMSTKRMSTNRRKSFDIRKSKSRNSSNRFSI
jgi:hypothetical protein